MTAQSRPVRCDRCPWWSTLRASVRHHQGPGGTCPVLTPTPEPQNHHDDGNGAAGSIGGPENVLYQTLSDEQNTVLLTTEDSGTPDGVPGHLGIAIDEQNTTTATVEDNDAAVEEPSDGPESGRPQTPSDEENTDYSAPSTPGTNNEAGLSTVFGSNNQVIVHGNLHIGTSYIGSMNNIYRSPA